ncbi:MAG: hypothetical protein O3B86_10400 [Planctomycetota bacterium]|nr:hypothetical protein [Planctomycetota bacterium]
MGSGFQSIRNSAVGIAVLTSKAEFPDNPYLWPHEKADSHPDAATVLGAWRIANAWRNLGILRSP